MIFLDYNAGAPLLREVRALLVARLSEEGTSRNPSSVHRAGQGARSRLEAAREKVAARLGVMPREVCFTGSGSESDALALIGGYAAREEPARNQVVVSAIEHPALLGAAALLEAEGVEVVRVPPKPDGAVAASEFIAALGPRTALCSLMWANNETGVLQPVAEVHAACLELGIPFHSDAIQAAGRVPLPKGEALPELLSLSAHKLGAPAGVGVLVVRRPTRVRAMVPGHQEGGLRGGTPDVAAVEAFALALELACERTRSASLRLARLRDRLEADVLASVEGARVNGAGAQRLPNTSNLRFDGVDGETLLLGLDLAGLCASSGAACASGTLSPSHVLLAMGLSEAEARGSLRLSLGHATREEEIDAAVRLLREQVPRARR